MEEQKPNEYIRPTKKQQELLAFIAAFIAEHGYSPSYREIMVGVGYNSVATVALHVGNLIKRGHLVKRGRSARSVEIVSSSVEPEKPIVSTNQIKPGEEKWLIEKLDYFFANIEQATTWEPQQLEDLAILIRALRILGLEGAAQTFSERLRTLQNIASDI